MPGGSPPVTTEPNGDPAVLNVAPRGKLGRFTAFNLIAAALPLLIAVATIPKYLNTFGEVRYGIWLGMWVLITYFGMFDLGLGRAMANSVAKLREASATERETVVWTGVAINLAGGIVVGALALGVGELILGFSGGLGGRFHAEIVASLPWLAATIPLFVVTSVLFGALEGVEHFLVANLVGTVGSVSAQVLPLAAGIVVGPRLDVLAAATTVALVLSATCAAAACFIYLPLTARPRFDRSRAAELVQFGAWITVTSLISPLMSTLDKLLIGAVSGARAVTHYTVPFNLVTRLWIFPSALARAVFPRFSQLAGADARLLADEASRVLGAIMTPIVVLAIIAVDPFLQVWVGRSFASEAALPAEILLLGLWVNSLAFIPYTLLQAQGRPDIPAKLHLLELLPFLGVLWVGIRAGGVAGAAAAWSARVFADAVFLVIAAKSQLRSQIYLLPAAILALAVFAVVQVVPASLPERALVGIAVAVPTLFWSWFVAPPSLRGYALRFRARLTPTWTR